MTFWGSATEAANRAFPMAFEAGLRKKEREEDRKIDQQRYNDQKARQDKQFEWEALDRKDKEQRDRGDRLVRMARQRWQSGDDMGAVSLYNEAYKNYPDGNDAMIILPQSNPQYFQQLIQQGKVDPKLAQSKLLIISSMNGGKPIPLNSMEELDMMAAEAFNQENYLNEIKRAKKELAEKNSQAEIDPVVMEDGRAKRKVFKIDQNGAVVFDDWVPYTGPLPESETNKALRMLNIDPYSLTPEDKRVLAGLQGRNPSAYEQKMGNIELGMRGRQEDRADEEHNLIMQQGGKRGSLLTPKDRAELRIKYRDQYIQEFGDPMGNIKKDAPDRESWIDEQMAKDMGLSPVQNGEGPTGGSNANPDAVPAAVNPSIQPSQKTGAKASIKFDDLYDSQGKILRTYDNGKQEVLDSNGKVITSRMIPSRVRIKLPAKNKGNGKKPSQNTSPVDGSTREVNGKKYIWDSNAKNPKTGKKGAWREIIKKGN